MRASAGGEPERFALAPMGRSIRWLTGALLAIPLLLVGAGACSEALVGSGPERPEAFVTALCAAAGV